MTARLRSVGFKPLEPGQEDPVHPQGLSDLVPKGQCRGHPERLAAAPHIGEPGPSAHMVGKHLRWVEGPAGDSDCPRPRDRDLAPCAPPAHPRTAKDIRAFQRGMAPLQQQITQEKQRQEEEGRRSLSLARLCRVLAGHTGHGVGSPVGQAGHQALAGTYKALKPQTECCLQSPVQFQQREANVTCLAKPLRSPISREGGTDSFQELTRSSCCIPAVHTIHTVHARTC